MQQSRDGPAAEVQHHHPPAAREPPNRLEGSGGRFAVSDFEPPCRCARFPPLWQQGRSAMRLATVIACTLCLTIAGIMPGHAEKRVALVIGNSGYRFVPTLPNPGNDARLMANTLRRLGFTLVGGEAQLDLDKAAIDRAVQTFGRELQMAEGEAAPPSQISRASGCIRTAMSHCHRAPRLWSIYRAAASPAANPRNGGCGLLAITPIQF